MSASDKCTPMHGGGSSDNTNDCTHPVALAGVFLHRVGQALDQTPQYTFVLCGNGGEKI